MAEEIIEFSLDHGDCENDKCILCALQAGKCPWCGATEACEHREEE